MILRTSAIAAICLLAGCDGGGNTSVQPAPPISNVAAFMGDSITHRWDLTQYDPNPTVNFGVDGDSTAQMLARFDAVIAIAPGVVVILGGINDGATSNTDSIKAMAGQATAAGIRVILCSVLPFSFQGHDLDQAHIGSLNQELINLAQANGYLYADYFDVMINPDGSQNQSLFVDGLHPNAAGYAKMWAVVAPLLAEDLN
jgi:lysophospholipase L1-like esterase